jgi:glutaredoxin
MRKFKTIKETIIKKTLSAVLLGAVLFGFVNTAFAAGVLNETVPVTTVNTELGKPRPVDIYFFGREDCQFCKAEKAFLKTYLPNNPDVVLTYYDIVKDPASKELFFELVKVNNLPKTAPLTLVGGKVIQGYDSDETTGIAIANAVVKARSMKGFVVEDYKNPQEILKSTSGCDQSGEVPCTIEAPDNGFEIKAPFIGTVNTKDFSLFTLSAMLGFIDGFNPCAMWVLITFLLALMQIGNRKKLAYVAGTFLLAEAVMYYLILTVWYSTWDFVGLDQIITPLVGFLSLASGIFFLYRYNKARKEFTCDVTSLEQQSKITKKIKKLANAPMNIATFFGILGLALSVNVIEFACSIGIPQVFTKTLELNALTFWAHQWYLFIYIIGYMADDIVIFTLAFYGINKIHASEKYSKLSLLIGGILMLILGAILVVAPSSLVF